MNVSREIFRWRDSETKEVSGVQNRFVKQEQTGERDRERENKVETFREREIRWPRVIQEDFFPSDRGLRLRVSWVCMCVSIYLLSIKPAALRSVVKVRAHPACEHLSRACQLHNAL